ncbi:MAG TPA: hypothetical protein VGM67_05240, partial [Gemmatimonadaceae bacterium]
ARAADTPAPRTSCSLLGDLIAPARLRGPRDMPAMPRRSVRSRVHVRDERRSASAAGGTRVGALMTQSPRYRQ